MGFLCGGGGGGGDSQTVTVRYAEYIETAHQNLINNAATYRAAIIGTSPFAALEVIDPADAFFASGYTIASFPTVYDMYGKFLAGLDVEVLWNQVHSDSAYGAVITEILNADSDLLEDELDEQLEALFIQARNINAVMSSSYIIADGNMRSKKIFAMAKELADLRARFSELAQRRWEKHLDWNSTVTEAFLKVNELFFNLHGKYLQNKATVGTSDLLWPFTVLDHERVIVACLQGATESKTKGETGGWSDVANVVGTAAGLMQIFSLFSDIRLKKFIKLIKGKYNQLGLKCYTWQWNKRAKSLGLTGYAEGVIAQEVMIKYPEAVVKERGFYKVNYGLLDKMLIV